MASTLAELFEKGAALFRQSRFEEAVAAYDAALALRPGQPRILLNRGQALRRLGRWEAAVADLQAAVQAEPGAVEPLRVLADLLFHLRRSDEAVAALQQAMTLRPGDAALQGSLGIALRQARRPRDAIAAFGEALALDPAGAFRPHRATCELQLGDFEAGFSDFESRREPDAVTALLRDRAPRWRGEDVRGKTVLVYAEQGLGDTIMFGRYVPLLAEAGARVLFAPQRPVRRLMQSLTGPVAPAAPVAFVDLGDALPSFDFHVRTMSLPFAFGTRKDSIPAHTPYLAAEAALAAAWGERLGDEGFRIGVAWKGSAHAEDQQRNFDPALLGSVAQIPGVRLISLQIDDETHDAAGLARIGIETPSKALDAGPDAFVDTAAVLTHCDLVITLDSAVAHLAAALGRPTWIALPRNAEWRWMLDRDDSPWHPTARLWRQAAMGRWDDVFAAIAQGVAALAGGA